MQVRTRELEEDGLRDLSSKEKSPSYYSFLRRMRRCVVSVSCCCGNVNLAGKLSVMIIRSLVAFTTRRDWGWYSELFLIVDFHHLSFDRWSRRRISF